MDHDDALAEKLNTAWRFLHGRGFVEGFGHISAQTTEPDEILVAPHSLGGRSTPEDFVRVDLEGRQIGSQARLPGELPIHLEVYRSREDVGSVAHFHCLYATSFGTAAPDLRPTYFPAAIFRSGIPVHPDPRFVNDPARGRALAATLGPHRAAIIRAHGVVVTGADVEEMVASAFLLEDNARRTWVSAAMGEVEYLGDEELAEIEAEILANRGPIRRIWALCEEEAAVEPDAGT